MIFWSRMANGCQNGRGRQAEMRRIVIVGGGTAGWLAALMLAARGQSITVIESSKIGTIGVGEGTTAVFRQMLGRLGISEMDFLRETGATIKYGIRHRDWRRLGHHYDGPIDDPHLVLGAKTNFLDQYHVAHGKSVGTAHLFQHLIDGNKAPFAQRGGDLVAAGPFHHAYHFDQALAGQFLRKQARGVTILDDQVTGIGRSETGDITHLNLESGTSVAGDFFIDCTGFRRRLIGEMGPKWQSYSDVLPLNRAMPFWLENQGEIAPVTQAWAQKSGWMWQIPTQGRMGCGYVYSDAHTTPDQAKAEIEAVLGHEIHPRNDIKIDAGRLSETWVQNCVALGLASSFLEPLEATSIHGTIVQLLLLTSLLPDPNPRARAAYNAACATQVDDFRDFIRLHYVSERRDSPFWRDIAASHPQALRDRLDYWAGRVPTAADFKPFAMGLPHIGVELTVPVLDGLGLLTAAPAQRWGQANPQFRAKAASDSLTADYTKAAAACLGHRAFLDQLHQELEHEL